MAQSKQQIRAHLASAGLQPKHRFGQNFMIDQNLVRLIADTARITPHDLIIEVGPGTGTLTEELLDRGARVVAVEIDRDLADHLTDYFAQNDRLRIIRGDALDGKHSIHPLLREQIAKARTLPEQTVKLVANLPYNIASPLVIDLLIEGVQELVFTVQKEVAERLKARSGTDAYGPLTVMTRMMAGVEMLRVLPPEAFWPVPKIESALVRMQRNDRLGARAREFGMFVHKLFSFRRKTLRKSLEMVGYDSETILKEMGMDANQRAETLEPEVLWQIFNRIFPSTEKSTDQKPIHFEPQQ